MIGDPGAPQARFNIETDSRMRKGGADTGSRVVVYSNGWAGRTPATPPDFTRFQVPLETDPNDPGTVDLTMIVFENP